MNSLAGHGAARLTVLLALLACGLAWTPAALAQPNTPEYAAQMVYESAHSFDVDTLFRYSCIEGQERAEIRQFFDDQVRNLEQAYGLDWNQVTIDFSQVEYRILEQVDDQARVQISGPYVINYQGEQEVDEDPDVIVVQKVDGLWLMCGDQDQAQLPLGESAKATPPSPRPQGFYHRPAEGVDENGPVHAARMAYESAHRLDADAFGQWACVDAATLEGLKVDFEELQQQSSQTVGVQWSQVRVDFSGLTYELLEQVGDQARVRVEGDYIITYPGGREVSQDPDVILVQKVDGRWLMCGDQDQAAMPLSPYSSSDY